MNLKFNSATGYAFDNSNSSDDFSDNSELGLPCNYFYSAGGTPTAKFARGKQCSYLPRRFLYVGNDTPIEMSNCDRRIAASNTNSADTISSLIADSARVITALAFLPTNPAHEEVVDRLIANRVGNAKSRKLVR